MSNPTISLALPYLETLSEDAFQYVAYQDDSNGSIENYYVGNHYKNVAETTEDENGNTVVTKLAENLDGVTPQWTWHIENEKENLFLFRMPAISPWMEWTWKTNPMQMSMRQAWI